MSRLKRFLPRQGANREERGVGRGRGGGTIPEPSKEGISVQRRGPSGVSFLMPSSPCRSLDPPRAGGVRAYSGEHLWGVVGAELEGLFKHLLRTGLGGRILLWNAGVLLEVLAGVHVREM